MTVVKGKFYLSHLLPLYNIQSQTETEASVLSSKPTFWTFSHDFFPQ